MTTVRHSLAAGDFSQNWTNLGLITLNDDWAGVPSIMGYLGDIEAGSPTGVDPRTLTGAALGAVDVIANQSNPDTLSNGGVAEFDGIANPTIALNGSGTADAPSLVIYLDATGRSDVRVRMNLRDLDGSADNANQQVAVQYRVAGGAWQNVFYIADASSGPSSATQVTAVDVTLGADANNQSEVEVRVLTTNAPGSDEWIGVDDILITSQSAPVATAAVTVNDVSIVEGDSGTTNLVFTITRSNNDGSFTVDFATADGTATAGSDYAATTGTLTFTAGGALSQQVVVAVTGDTDVEPGETLFLQLGNLQSTLGDASLADASGTGTITNDDLGTTITLISAIQGAAHTSPLVGQTVTTTGIVTAVDSNGFYLQSADADADASIATSEGIFVFTGSAPTVAVGQAINVTGTVSEFFPGGAATGNLSTTQLGGALTIAVLSSGNALPAAVVLGAGGRQLPTEIIDNDGLTSFDPTTDGIDFFESLEGMLVTVPTPRAIAPTNQFGEIYTVADNGAGATNLTPRGTIIIEGTVGDGLNVTNTGPGSDFNPERIQIDPDSTITPGVVPLVNAGAVLNDVTGVIGYNFGNFEVIPTAEVTVRTASPLLAETTTLAASEDVLTIATYNVLNLDPNDAPTGRFTAIAQQIVNRLGAPDIIALQEVQDNNGATNDGVVTASMTLQMLVDAISANGGPTYSFADNPFITDDRNGGEPGGNIRTAFLYQADRVSLESLATTTDPADQATNPANPFFDSRLPLVGTFEFNGQDVVIINNHFSSKGGGTPLFGTIQPSVNGSADQRLAQASNVADYVESLGPDAKVVVLGDLNEFTNEESLAPLFAAGLADMGATLPETDRYSFIFDGNAQALDQTFVSANLADAASYDIVHVNVEFAVTSASPSDHDPSVLALTLPKESNVAFTLQLLHFADAEAGLLASNTAKYLAANVDAFEDDFANSITLAGGDNFIPGPFLAAGTDLSVRDELNLLTGSTMTGNIPIAAADIALHNLIGVQASTIGNHEFDLGSNVFRNSFTPNAGWVGADFPYLSANLDFSGDADLAPRVTAGGQEASSIKGRIAPTAVITEGGEKIGLVAVTTQILEAISSPSGTEVLGFPVGPGANGEADNMALLAAQIQPLINGLIASGVNKIVLMSHLQILNNERALAELLTGVDIILAAGSNTRLGDADDVAVAFPGHSANFADTYPIVTEGADGKTTVIVNTDNEFTYLGRLVVDFDANGDIITESLATNVGINGAYASTAENVAAAWGIDVADVDTVALAAGTRGGNVKLLTDAVQSVITTKDGNVFGYSDVYLNGERIAVRNQETNLGNITADANADALRDALGAGAPPVIVSLKNGGGIRAQIGSVSAPDPVDGTVDFVAPGTVSQLDIENSLRFNNGLMAFDTTAAGLKAILEHGVAVLGNQGRFPQIGGVAFSYDPDLPAGSRILDIALVGEDGTKLFALYDNGVALPGAPATITVVTLNFLANGGDGYPIKANGENFRFLLNDGTLSAPVDEALNFTATGVVPPNILGEQQAMAEYMAERYATEESAFDEEDTAIQDDTRIQNLNFRTTDTVLFNSYDGTAGRDVLTGSALADLINGLAGNDTLNGEEGDDVLTGGLGADRLNGGAGSDTASYANAAGSVAASLKTNSGTFGEALGDRFSSIENLTGSNFDDALTGTAGVNVIRGGGGNDIIIGLGGLDQLFGDAGDDNFVFEGNQVFASIDGGTGTDTISAGADNTRIAMGAISGIEIITADGFANVTLHGSNGNNIFDLTGVTLVDIVAINGNGGNDSLTGSAGNDVVNGGAGNDNVNGGAGDDLIIGGLGIDQLTGGAGADTFQFTRADVGRTQPIADTILDFESGIDKIDLSRIDANTRASNPGDDAFTFIGTAAFSRTAGELRIEDRGSFYFLTGDTNGDGVGDFAINLAGRPPIVAADFVL